MLKRVARLPEFSKLRRALQNPEANQRVGVAGLRGTAFALLCEALRASLDRPIVVVYPDEESAEDAYSDFNTVSPARAVLFPERDIFPHRYETRENLTVRGDRNECLLKIVSNAADIVVTSLLGFLEKTISAPALMRHRVTVAQGATLDLEELRRDLVSLGYDTVHSVEEAGQFAVRGSIVDVFDPAWDQPVRIELAGDDVESMRTFDLDTQRSLDAIASVTILPAASVPFEEESISELRSYLEARRFSPEQIERIGSEITHSRYSPLWRRYAPALGVDGTLLDFFAAPPLVLFSDVGALDRAYAQLRVDIERVAADADGDFPLLAFEDYVHAPDYFDRYGVRTVWRHEIAGEAASEDIEAVFGGAVSSDAALRFSTASHPSVVGKLEPFVGQLRKLASAGVEIHIYSETPTQRERLADLLDEDESLVHLPVGWITSGFVWREAGLAVLTDHQIFNRVLARPSRRRKAKRRSLGARQEHLQVGDFVVHVDYGIGRFVGLHAVGSGEGEAECLEIRYDGGDRIYVPLDQMHLVEKYVGREGVVPQLDRLGGTRWQRTKERARKAIEDIARDLLKIYAQREIASGYALPPDSHWQNELEAAFPYEETPHQISVTREIKDDMESEKPMDRLVCGDVGYGKTEVAIRAAFKAATNGKQVAVLVPTTLLALQHYNTFTERMGRFPLRIEMLSRFASAKEQKSIVAGLAGGEVDIVVGTHRLLSRDVKFKRLGLLVVDEEHRFGVKHKERLKEMTRSVHVLSLTATPIPRTLYMSLSGLRNISIIDTPPRNRHPVKTEVMSFSEDVIQRAVAAEVARDGQVFFVHNRVRSIGSMNAFLQRLLPGIRLAVAHGQMGEKELERVMVDFMERKYDVLVSTMIIESGLDFPNVNTIVVNRADRFGLAQLYQLRGRVGRREQQAFAYFLVPRQMSLTESATHRLQAMEEFEELGSGYRLAMRDLEIRGAGNVLGVEQHGHVAAIGFEMYCKMLKEAVDELRGEETPSAPACRVETPHRCYIPDTYVSSADERMLLYKRLARMTAPDEVDAFVAELTDRFGAPPEPVGNLADLTRIKLGAVRLGVGLVQVRRGDTRPPTHARAMDQAAEPPRTNAAVPRNVPRARHGATRLARQLAATQPAPGLEVQLDFAPGRALRPEQCAQLVETFGDRVLFKSGEAFGVRLRTATLQTALTDARNLLQAVHL